MVWVAKTRPPPGLSRIEPAISSWPRAHLTISSPACVSSGLGLRISTRRLLSGKPVERITGQPVHRPLGVRFGAELLVEADRVDVPVEHRPLHAAAVALHGDLREVDEQRSAESLAAVGLEHIEVLEVEPGLGEESRVVVKEEREPDRRAVLFGEQCLCIWTRSEHADAQLVLGHRDLVLELFVLGQRADERRHGRHIVRRCGPDRDCHRGRSFNRYTRRIAPCESEKLAILLSTRPASSPAWMTSVSRSSLRPPLGRTTHTAPFGSIHDFTWLMRRRSVRVSADRNTRSH